MSHNERANRKPAKPKAWWQRSLAGERLPKGFFNTKSKCDGTVEDYRGTALDVRELIRQSVFKRPVGSRFNLNLRFPWLRVMRLKETTLELQLVTGRAVVVPLVSVRCGAVGERMRLECPLCGQRTCVLYYLEPRLACRRCNSLWYAAQGKSSFGRKALARQKIRRKLGDYGQLWAAKYPPKPHRMWRRTYARHCAALDRIERKLGRYGFDVC